ncbi:MAG TPA: IS21 family transposase [Candidatus Acidoferrales bacterium]|nr:IS21 family transposase [Candidatus Acidoferrales bacterium]
MLKRHEVEILLKAGHPKTEVAHLTGVSLRSVKRIAGEAPVVHVDDAAEREKRRIGRPSLVEDFRKLVVAILEAKADLPSLEILRRVREAGYQGGKTALYALVASLRPREVKPLVRFEGLPGEFSQHDFGQVDVEFLNGSTLRIHFFASRLKYSRYIRVSLVKDETVESLVRNLAEHLHSWGGVPLLCVFDRPKTVALKWRRNGEVTEWNPVFAYAMLEMGIGVELCWPSQPQQKGAVENLVGFVKSSFFKVRRFHDEEDLEQQLLEWHQEVNEERPCRATGVIPVVRLAEEAARLRPLKVRPEDLALRIPVYVGPTGTALHDGHPYSMPPEAISMPGTLYLYADRVRIVAGRHEVVHPRKFVPHQGSTLAAHRAAMVAAVSGKRGKRYLKRQQLLELGEPAFLYLTEIVHRRPRQWFYDIDRLHDLLQRHGPEVLRRALEEGLKEQVFGAAYIERFLQHSLVFPEVIQ